jgi:hypothetical protein
VDKLKLHIQLIMDGAYSYKLHNEFKANFRNEVNHHDERTQEYGAQAQETRDD